jgi:hypothetical protein
MSQQQEPSLNQLRNVRDQFGHDEALKQASLWIDGMTDELGRARDMNFAVMLSAGLWGAACGFFLGWLIFK